MNVYDFDKTIYNGDSTIDFYLFCVRSKLSLLRYLPAQLLGFVSYILGYVDKTTFKERFFRFVRGIDVEEYVEAFWAKNAKKVAGWYMERQESGDVVISASPDFLLRPICRQLGIYHLIASDVDPKTGRFLSGNCYGETKVERFKEAFGECQIDNFYSDSYSDAPMARLAKRSFLIVKGQVTEWSKAEGKEESGQKNKTGF